MKAWIFVEGEGDKLGLQALWKPWQERLRKKRRGIAIIPLHDKAQLLRQFGHRAAEKLIGSSSDVVVGLPDFYPTAQYKNTPFAHDSVQALKRLQLNSVRSALESTFGVRKSEMDALLDRVCPALLKHDFEMLLLAARKELNDALGTSERGSWREPVEKQNLDKPPKRIVEELFLKKSVRRKAYRDTKDAPAILGKVKDIPTMLKTTSGQCTCPEFVSMLRWLGERLDEPCCALD